MIYGIIFIFFGKLITDNYKKIKECSKQIEKLEIGEIPLEQAREISRTSQAILESVRLEIEYSKLINRKLIIDFMEDEIQ